MTINNLTESIHKSNVVEDDWVEIDEVFNLESSADDGDFCHLLQFLSAMLSRTGGRCTNGVSEKINLL